MDQLVKELIAGLKKHVSTGETLYKRTPFYEFRKVYPQEIERWKIDVFQFLERKISRWEANLFFKQGTDISTTPDGRYFLEANRYIVQVPIMLEHLSVLINNIRHSPKDWGEKLNLIQPETVRRQSKSNQIFIGHGRDDQWRELSDVLTHDGYKTLAYEYETRPGLSTKEVLKSMITKCSIALVVMTAEDEVLSGKDAETTEIRARENVVHEIGLCQGSIGWERTFILLEEGVNEFSNIHGLHQIRFKKGNIKDIVGDVRKYINV